MATIGLVPAGGLGMAATRLSQAGRPARVTEALYCPAAVRDDPGLAAAVQQHLDDWAGTVGLAPGPVSGLGRLVVLAHPDTHDVGRLAVAGRLLAVGRVLAGGALGGSDDELWRRAPGSGEAAGAGAVATGASVATGGAAAGLPDGTAAAGLPGSAVSAVSADSAVGAGIPAEAASLSQALQESIAEVYHGCDIPDAALPSRPDLARPGIADPALLSAMAGLSALPASPYQVQRVRQECQALSGAAPTATGPRPPWEYLSLGHVNAYSPALAALDAVDGYELTPSSSADPELRRAQRLAALAAALLHDIAAPAPSGLTAAIARAEGLGPGAASRRAAAVHDEAMRAFQHHGAQLAATADSATRRYLSGLWTWLGGHRSWHAVS